MHNPFNELWPITPATYNVLEDARIEALIQWGLIPTIHPKTSAVWAYCQGTNIPYIKITETK